MITVAPYDYEVELYLGGTHKDINRVLKRLGSAHEAEDDWEGLADHLGSFVIWVRHNDQNVIAHECTHLVWRILRHASVPVTWANEELMASHIGKLVAQVTQHARRMRRKKGA